MSRVFYGKEIKGLALHKTSAIFFRPLSPAIICLICVVIRHALVEQGNDSDSLTRKFEANRPIIGSYTPCIDEDGFVNNHDR